MFTVFKKIDTSARRIEKKVKFRHEIGAQAQVIADFGKFHRQALMARGEVYLGANGDAAQVDLA